MKKQTVTVASNRNKELKYSPGAFRDLLNLQIFDIIMGQVDRNPGNYMCQTQDKEDTDVTEITHITGIDNDMCGGLLEYNEIYMTGTEGIDKLKKIQVFCKTQILFYHFPREAEQICHGFRWRIRCSQARL